MRQFGRFRGECVAKLSSLEQLVSATEQGERSAKTIGTVVVAAFAPQIQAIG
jgi:hypothetical protein